MVWPAGFMGEGEKGRATTGGVVEEQVWVRRGRAAGRRAVVLPVGHVGEDSAARQVCVQVWSGGW